MRDVTGVHHEVRLEAERVHLVDRRTEGRGHIEVGGSGETQVAVAYLNEPQCAVAAGRGRRGGATIPGDVADHFATRDCQHHSRAEPGGVPHQLTPGHPVLVSGELRLISTGASGIPPGHETTTFAVMNG